MHLGGRVVTPDVVHFANVGDARVRPREVGRRMDGAQVSVDDSVAAQAVERGVSAAAALALPGGHAITALARSRRPALAPHMTQVEVGPGDLILPCSDGLWNYVPTDEEMSELLTTMLAGEPEFGPVCERLVAWAIERGGADNICVAVGAVRQPRPKERWANERVRRASEPWA